MCRPLSESASLLCLRSLNLSLDTARQSLHAPAAAGGRLRCARCPRRVGACKHHSAVLC